MPRKRMNEIVRVIRARGEAVVILNGDRVTIGFENAGKEGSLVMLGGGYSVVRTASKSYDVAKGELVETVDDE